MTGTPRAAGANHLSAAERAAVSAYLARVTGTVRDLAARLEVLQADLRLPASPTSLPGQPGATPPGQHARIRPHLGRHAPVPGLVTDGHH